MKVVIKQSLASLLECSYEESFQKLFSFYKTLSVHHEEYLSFTPENITKIVNFFNEEKNCELVGNEIIKEAGLEGLVSHEELTVFDITSMQNSEVICQIIVFHRIEITDEQLKDYFDKSKQKFFQFLKNKVSDEKVSPYSLYSESSIDCLKLSCYNNNKKEESNVYNIRFEASYSLDKENPQHIKKYLNERCNFKTHIANDGRMNFTVLKSY